MKNITAIIISFLRPEYTKKCISSLRETYPDIKILVGENGEYSKEMDSFCKEHKAKYIDLPFDSGVCVARNKLIEQVKTKYVLVGDDDFYYEGEALVENMALFLDNTDYDLIGGRVREGEIKNYQGFIEIYDDHFEYKRLNLHEVGDVEVVSALKYKTVDITFNFFVARVESIKDVKWDEKIKVAYEHSAWFIDLKKAGKKVAFSPDPIVTHKPPISEKYENYIPYRMRKGDKERFFERFNIAYTIDMSGRYDYGGGREKIKYIDFCITTFMRQDCLERLLFSIVKYYPEANIYIADQNKKFDKNYYTELYERLFKAGLFKKPVTFNVGHDTGLSYSRNFLVDNTPNIYKLILDDDFIFTEETKIEKFVDVLEDDQEIGIVGGVVSQAGQDIHFEHWLKRKGQTLYHIKDTKDVKDKDYKITGCVLNFALMRNAIFNDIKWDDELKVSEHTDFYYRFPHDKWKVAYTDKVRVDHPVHKSEEYKVYRNRDEFMIKLFIKHDLKKIKYANGQCFELDGESIKSYKETPEHAIHL